LDGTTPTECFFFRLILYFVFLEHAGELRINILRRKRVLETQGTARFYYGKNLDKKNHALQKEPNHLLNKGRKA